MSLSNADNTLRRSRNLGELFGRRRNISGIVGRRDKLDFYRLNLAEASDFSLTLGRTRSSDRLTVRLHNASGGVIRTLKSARNGRPQTITNPLGTGTHYISVRLGSRNNAKYRLTTSATLIEPGDLPATSRNIGVLGSGYGNVDSIGGTDTVDYYRFSTNQIGDFTATLGGLAQSVSMSLVYDINNNGLVDLGELVDRSSGSTTQNGFISDTLPIGNYFLSVNSFASTPYQLNLTFNPRPGNLPIDPSNNLSTAYDLGVLSGNVSVSDLVGPQDELDYYRFSVNQISDLRLTLGGLARDVRLQLGIDRNANGVFDSGERIDSENGSPTANGFIFNTLPPGNYFVLASTSLGSINTRYDLNFEWVGRPGNLPIDPSNNSSSAYDLGVFFGSATLVDLVGPTDDTDYYKFTLDQARNFSATLSNVSEQVRLTLGIDSNNNGIFDSGERLGSAEFARPTEDAFIGRTLQPGTYFLEAVSTSSLGRNTRYQLALVAP